MSGFKALNIESDDESDIEVDDTKEIQIEEALKLYQNALRYHAEGSISFDRAAEAYQELFASDIFSYPESQAELRRLELYGPDPEVEDLWDDSLGVAVTTVVANTEGGPSTLPQILHLSHKNYAQFKLEVLRYELSTQDALRNEEIFSEAAKALEHFVSALDKDDTDLDLWRRTASVGSILDSKRVARFCLEAVLDGDDEAISSVMSLPGLEESFAREQLRKIVTRLGDSLSLLQSPLSTKKHRQIPKLLKQRLDPYVDIETRHAALGPFNIHKQQAQRTILPAPWTWAEAGEVLLKQTLSELQGLGSATPALALSFDLSNSPLRDQSEKERPGSIAVDGIDHASSEEPPALPSTIIGQFPGLDKGAPTVQPSIADADSSMAEVSRPDAEAKQTDENFSIAEPQDAQTIDLPTRKRSITEAALNETEEGRTKSKRIRARESVAGPVDTIDANIQWEFEQQLAEFQAADEWIFDTIGGIFDKIGAHRFSHAKDVRKKLERVYNGAPTEGKPESEMELPASDLFAFLNEYTEEIGSILLVGADELDLRASGSSAAYTSAGSAHSQSGLSPEPRPLMDLHAGVPDILQKINAGWNFSKDATYKWLLCLLTPNHESLQPALSDNLSSYTGHQWPEALKTIVVRALVGLDDHIYGQVNDQLAIWDQRLSDLGSIHGPVVDRAFIEVAEATQAIFELHLDIYSLIKQPNSGVDEDTIVTQSERLDRWADLARDAINMHSSLSGLPSLKDDLNLRFLWATTFHVSTSENTSQDHVVECMQELRVIFTAVGEPVIGLQNNAAMPELSLAALDREISRLTTREFFLKVTDQDQRDPVAIIESLEPLLKLLDRSADITPPADGISDSFEVTQSDKSSSELVKFLRSSDTTIQVLLWQRLREAYETIEYAPMVVICYFSSIKIVLGELKKPSYLQLPQLERRIAVLKTLRIVQGMIQHIIALIQKSIDALDCMDEEYLRSATDTLGEVLYLLQVFNVFEDYLRVGQRQAPVHEDGLPLQSFTTTADSLHDMQLHTWMLQYYLLKEAIAQNQDIFAAPLEVRFDFLKTVHRSLGIRGICGGSNRAFVKLLKDELFQMTSVEGYEVELAQVLYDMYGLKCFLNPAYECIEHKCAHDAFLDRGVAMQSVDLLLAQAAKISMKELPKHPLKDTIEKVHGAIVRKKPSDAILRNREVCRAYLKSPINPINLYKCLEGEGNQLTVTPVPQEQALLASKGWFFLMGHIALSKFRSQKRTVATPTEDVEIAIAFFMQDLEYSMDNWETWYRLGQAYDTKLEESVVWSAEKLNNSMPEITQLQRAAIHAYTMATALALRSADLQFETSGKMADLYSDFAMRIYSSSSPPFSMLAYSLEDTEKFFSAPGLVKGKPFQQMRKYTALKFAKVLFQRAIASKPQQWNIHYMLGKCLWKMHSATEDISRYDERRIPSARQVLDAFTRTLELLPGKRESKDNKREPLLEPHYKLVSVVHKLVMRNSISTEEACDALNATPFARTTGIPKQTDEWVPHILAVLKNLRTADKSNWHHRMIARAAQIIYDQSEPSGTTQNLGAISAKHELTQQMFTKTMVLQVWRPEGERAGRHFVYTSAYTRFFVHVLEQLKDRSSLEALARRVRRRPHEFFQHAAVWQEICAAYLRLLREYGALAEGLETSTFSSIAHDDFLIRKEPLEKWMQHQGTGANAALDVLREVQELKKINSSYMKPGPIDDLIGDAYAQLFNTIGKQVWEEDRLAKQQEQAARPPPPPPSPQRNPMMSLTHLMNLDGGNDSPGSAPALKEPEQAPTIRRKIGVGRREIRTCAEACGQKPAPSSPTLSSGTGRAAQAPIAHVVIQVPRSGIDKSIDLGGPGSLQDSADDESELSELEEVGSSEDEDEGTQDYTRKPEVDLWALQRQLWGDRIVKVEPPVESREGSNKSKGEEVEVAEQWDGTSTVASEDEDTQDHVRKGEVDLWALQRQLWGDRVVKAKPPVVSGGGSKKGMGEAVKIAEGHDDPANNASTMSNKETAGEANEDV